MTRDTKTPRLTPIEAKTLCELLDREDRVYRLLLQLARSQSALLRGQDVAKLENNAELWQKYLPLADSVRKRREGFVTDLTDRLGLPRQRRAAQSLADYADAKVKRQVQKKVQSLVQTASELCRQNEKNHQVAGFCLDLVREETRIFQQGVLEDPSGRYAGDARPETAPPGGVLIRQA